MIGQSATFEIEDESGGYRIPPDIADTLADMLMDGDVVWRGRTVVIDVTEKDLTIIARLRGVDI